MRSSRRLPTASCCAAAWLLAAATVAPPSTATGVVAFLASSSPKSPSSSSTSHSPHRDDANRHWPFVPLAARSPPFGSGPTTTTLYEGGSRASTVGEPLVDMNQYNLPLDSIPSQWTAKLVAGTNEIDEGVYLFANDERTIFVDEFDVSFPRREGGGLGLELQEVAGGREDGVGITIVTGLVEDGAAASASAADILPGDSIANVAVVRKSRGGAGISDGGAGGGLAETDDIAEVRTECLGYDATVAALGSLPPPLRGTGTDTTSGTDPTSAEETFVLRIKRLRRKPKVKVNLQYPPSQNEPDSSITMFAGENLRLGMLVRGVKLNDPLAQRFDTKTDGNCGAGGLCRTCSVSVTKGGELLNPQKMAEKQMLDSNPRWRLACKAFVGYGMQEGEMTIKVNPRQWES